MLLTRNQLFSVLVILLISTRGPMADDFARAEEYLEQGKLDKANWIYFSSLDKNERIDEAHLGLAKSMWHAKKYAASLQYVNKYLDSHPDNREALLLRSQLYILLQQWENAVADIKRLSPGEDNPNLFLLLNIAYENLDQRDLAKQAKAEYYRLEARRQPE